MSELANQKVALVTGAAGFIGFSVSNRLLKEGWRVIGLDSISDYYDISLKEQREKILLTNSSYRSIHEKVETPNVLMNIFHEETPDLVIHLAAQAGVRYSIENPRSYLESNILGTFEKMLGNGWNTCSEHVRFAQEIVRLVDLNFFFFVS